MGRPNLPARDLIARALLAILAHPEDERRAEIEAGAALAYHDAGAFDRPAITRAALELARAVADQDAGDNFDLSMHYAGADRRGGDEGLTAGEARELSADHFNRAAEAQQAVSTIVGIVANLDALPADKPAA